MPKKPTYVIPDTHRPEEFLTDDKLAVYYQELSDADPDDADLKVAAARANAAAATTKGMIAIAEAGAAGNK